MTTKPVFFISSTILDFADLRGAIKWWLEENDYIVNASEYNDFLKPIDENSYKACLKAIDISDYFILIIGTRIGGTYEPNITITQKEYQYAYQRVLEGKLKIINFIRTETWLHFNDYRNKIKALKEEGLDCESIYFQLKLTEDDKIRFNFINEVRRVDEMKVSKKPKNNWIHVFNDFSDIVTVVKNELGDKIGLSFKQKRFIIIEEIKKNLSKICSKNNENGNLETSGFLSQELFIDFIFDLDKKETKLSEKQFLSYSFFYISYWQFKKLSINYIDSFYKDGYFLEYNTDANDYITGKINQIALQLLNSYKRINSFHESMYKDSSLKIATLSSRKKANDYTIDSIDVLFALDFYDSIINCVRLSKSLYRALKGLEFDIPELIMNERITQTQASKKENILTMVDIEDFLEK